MKLEALKQQLWMIPGEWRGWCIMETLNTHLDRLKWITTSGSCTGTGFIDEYEIQVKLDSITYHQISGLNITFAVKHNDKFEETFQNMNIESASKIFGGVVNAIRDKIDNFEWDFLCLIAKDNIEKRSILYNSIATRVMRSIHPGIVYSMKTERIAQSLVTIIYRKNTTIDLEEIFKKLSSNNA